MTNRAMIYEHQATLYDIIIHTLFVNVSGFSKIKVQVKNI